MQRYSLPFCAAKMQQMIESGVVLIGSNLHKKFVDKNRLKLQVEVKRYKNNKDFETLGYFGQKDFEILGYFG